MNAKTQAAVIKHGAALLGIFPGATERDPVKLCRKLRKLEREGAALALRLCNGPDFGDNGETADAIGADILGRVNALLGNDTCNAYHEAAPVFLNRDPRGYALKIRDDWMRAQLCQLGNRWKVSARVEGCAALRRDWGGYGIIAPDLTEK